MNIQMVATCLFGLEKQLGEEIDRMGLFEADTQRMTKSIDSAEFPPARELLCDGAARERLKKAISMLPPARKSIV